MWCQHTIDYHNPINVFQIFFLTKRTVLFVYFYASWKLCGHNWFVLCWWSNTWMIEFHKVVMITTLSFVMHYFLHQRDALDNVDSQLLSRLYGILLELWIHFGSHIFVLILNQKLKDVFWLRSKFVSWCFESELDFSVGCSLQQQIAMLSIVPL
jgi:hypothetical protein